MYLRAMQGEVRKREAQEHARTLAMQEQDRKMRNAERVVQAQRDRLEAQLRLNQEKV